jgi:glycosyltransferase involved in cell wall biosynthesis
MPTITAVIPAYNEEDIIEETILALQSLKEIDKILVVNDGSTDATEEAARRRGVQVINLTPNQGKGAALNAAIPYITTDLVVFIDADLGPTAVQANRLIEPVARGEADLCIATFPPPRKKGGAGIVKKIAGWAIYRAGKIKVKAPLSGQRVMTKEVLGSVVPFHQGYGVELGMTLRALAQGYKILEIPTTMSHKETGRDLQGFLHRGRQLVDVLKVICE